MNKQTIRYGSDIEWMPVQIESSHFQDEAFLSRYEDVLMQLGTKDNPTKVKGLGQYHNDTVFVEGATPIARSTEQLLAQMYKLHTHLEAVAGMTLKGYDHIIMPDYDTRKFNYLFAESMHMGCAPDTCNGEIRVVPDRVRKQVLRECGLHLHFDLPPTITDQFSTVLTENGQRVMVDGSGMVASIINDWADASSIYHAAPKDGFQQWYRRPGTYRVKPYGVEYRSIGGAVFNDSDKLAGLLGTLKLFTQDVWRVFA